MVFLDITASIEKRKTLVELVKSVAEVIRIPFTVGGGISTIDDISVLLDYGADKVSLNTAAVKNPNLIYESSKRFGSQAIVVAVDVKRINDTNKVFIKGGNEETKLKGIDWCKKIVELGAGEILLTSMDKDGTRNGYDVQFLSILTKEISVPVIASGGAGKLIHFEEAFEAGADACLAASLFHYQELKISELKKYLFSKGIPVRL